jgi:exopolyphosphatase/guanosine-5'-triphosphate,3'-diphosphate pyrophosphatase
MTITRLGAGIDATRRLDPLAVERTVTVLKEYAELARHHGVGRLRAVATSALRDAEDEEAFLEPAAEVLGVVPEVLAGAEEGRLSFAGATAGIDSGLGPFLVVDIGGGSTEFIFGEGEAKTAVSLDVGCVRVTERYLLGDPPTSQEIAQARAAIRRQLSEGLGGDEPWGKARLLVGLAGTVSALTVIALGLEAFEEKEVHHARLSLQDVSELASVLAGLDVAGRRQLRGMEAARADVLLGGALVLEEAMGHLGRDELLVSEADILDGIAFQLLEAEQVGLPNPSRSGELT